jgi:hypothetical protein
MEIASDPASVPTSAHRALDGDATSNKATIVQRQLEPISAWAAVLDTQQRSCSALTNSFGAGAVSAYSTDHVRMFNPAFAMYDKPIMKAVSLLDIWTGFNIERRWKLRRGTRAPAENWCGIVMRH